MYTTCVYIVIKRGGAVNFKSDFMLTDKNDKYGDLKNSDVSVLKISMKRKPQFALYCIVCFLTSLLYKIIQKQIYYIYSIKEIIHTKINVK